MRIYLFCVLLLGLLCPPEAYAQEQSMPPHGTVNPNAPQALHALDYLRGTWEVISYTKDSTGTFVRAPQTSSFRARFLYDGYSMQTEYYSPSPDDFYSTTIITHDATNDDYSFTFFNAKLGRRVVFTGHATHDGMVITNQGGYGQRGTFIYRETDSVVSSDYFVKRIHRSDDEGQTWQEQPYYFEYKRQH